jgi:hypothetical protein
MSNGRSRARVLIATVTPRSVETRNGANGAYTVMTGAAISREGREDLIRTVMAFGRPNERISPLLRPGAPVRLVLRFSGGNMKIVGIPRDGIALMESPDRIVRSILADAGIDDDMAQAMYLAMTTGATERPVDEEIDLDPDMMEEMGSIVLPIIDAGIAIDEAVVIAERIMASPAADALEEAAMRIRQDTARSFI